MHEDLITAIEEDFPGTRVELERLVRIPSVSASAFDPGEVRRSAEEVAAILEGSGAGGVRLLEMEGAHPAVFGEIPAPAGAPTVLLYAHHDVQPAGPADLWESPPFGPVERDGRLYGRGTADDKAGVVAHAAVLRAFGGRPPVGVKVFVEGEEEVGSAHLGDFLRTYGDLLGADVIVILDTANWRVGHPALTTMLRGIAAVTVQVGVLESGVHSGLFGGPIPDALTILCRILGTLHDAEGRVAVPGLVSDDADPLDLTEEELRAQAGVRSGIRLIGEGSLTSRLWTRPSISVLSVDAPPVEQSINQLLPVARAKVSMRVAPGDDAVRAQQALRDHLLAQDAWGAEVTVTAVEAGQPYRADLDDPRVAAVRNALASAWDHDVAEIGIGGSIPFVAEFEEANPEAAILLTGVADPLSRTHGPNESQHLGDLERAIVGEAIALRNLAGQVDRRARL